MVGFISGGPLARPKCLKATMKRLPKRIPLLLLLTTMSCVFWTPASRRTGVDARVIPNVPTQLWDIKS